jgi:hypothetical protein
MLNRINFIGHDIVYSNDRVADDVRNKHVLVYFLEADLMLGVERQTHANRNRTIIIDHDIDRFLDSQKQI